MAKHVCVIDLDSTHITHQLTHQPAVIHLLQQQVQAGLTVVVCTNVSLPATQSYLAQLQLPDSALVITNGGQTVETVSGKILFNQTLPQAYYQQISRFAADFGLETLLYDRHQQIQSADAPLAPNFDQTAVVSAVITGEPLTLNTSCAALDQALGDQAFLIRIADGAFRILPVLNHKAQALAAILAELPEALTLTVLGDGFSVVPMFAQATQAVGLQHGSPLALRHADQTISLNDLPTLSALLSA